ncbi:MAG: flavodoxin family protein [Candidatus Paceibacterota bacterium]
MIKIIGLSCSPSRGRNSDKMLDNFILGMQEVKNIEVEKMYLEDIKIDLYKYENRLGPGTDEQDFAELCHKISDEIHGLVIATPTYNFSVPAHLKNFIDRISFFALDFENKTKLHQPKGTLGHIKTYFLVSGGTPNWAQTILFFTFPGFWLRGIFLYFDAKVMGAYYSGDTATYKNTKILEKCRKKGKKFAHHVLMDKDKGILEKVFFRPPQI